MLLPFLVSAFALGIAAGVELPVTAWAMLAALLGPSALWAAWRRRWVLVLGAAAVLGGILSGGSELRAIPLPAVVTSALGSGRRSSSGDSSAR